MDDPIQTRELELQISDFVHSDATRAVVDSQVAIYPVNVVGLETGALTSALNGLSGFNIQNPGSMNQTTYSQFTARQNVRIALRAERPDAINDRQKLHTRPPQTSGTYVVDLDPDAFHSLLASGMPLHQELALAPGRYRLRLSDLGNHRLGTLEMPVEVGSMK